MDRFFFFWFQLVKSSLIRSYLILLEQRFTIGLQGGWWKMTQSAVCYGGLWEGHLSTKTSLTQAMLQKDIFLTGIDIMTWNVMGQEVEKPVSLCRVTLLLHWEPCVSLWIHLSSGRERSLVHWCLMKKTELWFTGKGHLNFSVILHYRVTHYQLYSVVIGTTTKCNCPYAPNEGGKIPSTGQVFLYENPWILCIGSTFLVFKLTF